MLFHETLLNTYVEAWSQPKALTNMINWYRALGRTRLKLQKIIVDNPTLLLWGKHDKFIH